MGSAEPKVSCTSSDLVADSRPKRTSPVS
jgi:hypothetical protein